MSSLKSPDASERPNYGETVEQVPGGGGALVVRDSTGRVIRRLTAAQAASLADGLKPSNP